MVEKSVDKGSGQYSLGISAYYHDSAACLLRDGEIVAAAQEERFSRVKHDPRFPHRAIRYCLKEAKITFSEVGVVIFYEKPFLKLERLLETYLYFAPRGGLSFISAAIVWIKEKFFLRSLIEKELLEFPGYTKEGVPLLFTDHHLSHAASAFYPSPFDEAAILTIDGVGEWATTTIATGEGADITLLDEVRFPHSLGLYYSAATYYLGFRVNSGEYKLMGLAPYGNSRSDEVAKYKDRILRHVVDVQEDGSVILNQDYFNYATGLTMTNDKKWENLLQIPRRLPESPLEQRHCDLALAIQEVLEEVTLRLVRYTKKRTGKNSLCLAGGVALNCVSNAKITEAKIFENVWIQPAAGDAGGAVGAAFAAYYIYKKNKPLRKGNKDSMKGSYLGPSYSDCDIELVAEKYGAVYSKETNDTLYGFVAKLLSKGNIVGWMQDRMEWGPRALGNRSILGDPRDPAMQKKLNLHIKYREGFRPFAPSVLDDSFSEFFKGPRSPYMLQIAKLTDSHRKRVQEEGKGSDWKSRLYQLRSDVPAITHLDYSARTQTVSGEYNKKYWKLLTAFKEVTGYGLLVNTSFNVRGQPIVCSPEDAYRCFMSTEMDYLVMNDYVFSKVEQPALPEEDRVGTQAD